MLTTLCVLLAGTDASRRKEKWTLKSLQETISKLTKENADLSKENADLVASNRELVTENVELTKDARRHEVARPQIQDHAVSLSGCLFKKNQPSALRGSEFIFILVLHVLAKKTRFKGLSKETFLDFVE